jgi:hypothetical protein
MITALKDQALAIITTTITKAEINTESTRTAVVLLEAPIVRNFTIKNNEI